MLFPESVWVDACRPGYILASLCRDMLTEYKAKNGSDANLLFLQNHGVFFASDSVEGIDQLVSGVMSTLETFVEENESKKLDKLADLLREYTGYKFVGFVKGEGVNAFDTTRFGPLKSRKKARDDGPS